MRDQEKAVSIEYEFETSRSGPLGGRPLPQRPKSIILTMSFSEDFDKMELLSGALYQTIASVMKQCPGVRIEMRTSTIMYDPKTF